MRCWWLGLLCMMACPSPALAQATEQLWGHLALDWLATDRLTYELRIEPKVQPFVHGDEATWMSLDTTPMVEYAVAKWVDVRGEVDIGYTKQRNNANTLRVIPRAGIHLHIFSRIMQTRAPKGAAREKHPNRRANISTLVRFENGNNVRNVRSRSELVYPLNRPQTTADGAIYLKSDGELFFPVGSAVAGGIVSEIRLRAGVGYRRSFAWRFEALYVWIGERSGESGAMAPRSHAVQVRLRRQF